MCQVLTTRFLFLALLLCHRAEYMYASSIQIYHCKRLDSEKWPYIFVTLLPNALEWGCYRCTYCFYGKRAVESVFCAVSNHWRWLILISLLSKEWDLNAVLLIIAFNLFGACVGEWIWCAYSFPKNICLKFNWVMQPVINTELLLQMYIGIGSLDLWRFHAVSYS